MNVRLGQQRLNDIAKSLEADNILSPENKKFLVDALYKIASGQDAEKAFGVKASRGERKGEADRLRKYNRQYIDTWIAAAIKPEKEGGLGITIREAVKIIKPLFKDLPHEDSLVRQFHKVKKKIRKDFEIKRI